ncbi:uncharacterized protein J4E84_006741 [Alternaria hordeiaustralica]|uniref:uncharacterized protein n=1 Tax=Alternaria hordeiaustralica TaxID=1187925 RepID=UPI0020C3BCF1|nr:uncharacterized protein J4E84_006741 [Alternaria hordeiaustralica]KAI4683901.1 hypothetical protein J4E84_006741 [Alternaria hordeiaustralica]
MDCELKASGGAWLSMQLTLDIAAHAEDLSIRIKTSSMPTLLELPRELRDLIYDHYFSVDGGYVHDFASNKLRQADGQNIELSLVLVCRQIADETRALGLRINTLRFSTFHSDATQVQAGLLHATHESINKRKVSLLNASAPDLLSSEDAQTIKIKYPQFAPMIDIWRSHGGLRILDRSDVDCGEAPSIWRDFVAFTLNLVSQNPGFAAKAKAGSQFWRPYDFDDAMDLNNACFEPWCIVDATEIERLQKKVTYVCDGLPYTWPNAKYSYSAATVSFRFLDSLSNSTRETIRKIVLLEDHQSIADPASHGRGYITLCQSHPKMRVERLVCLWETVFPVAKSSMRDFLYGSQDLVTKGLLDDERCPAGEITKAVGMWIKEAMALFALGMPKDSFTLVLDGDPIPEHTSHVFSTLQRDAAWQDAFDACYVRGILAEPSWFDRRINQGYMYEGLPEVVRTLSPNSSPIRTNFPLGSAESYDVERLLRENQGWSIQDWKEGWARHEPEEFQTEAPLPPWHLLRWGNVIL